MPAAAPHKPCGSSCHSLTAVLLSAAPPGRFPAALGLFAAALIVAPTGHVILAGLEMAAEGTERPYLQESGMSECVDIQAVLPARPMA